MLRAYWIKRRKILRGIVNTKLRKRGQAYNPDTWWDRSFYTSGVSDSKTISPVIGDILSRYHYASVEGLILRHLANSGFEPSGRRVLDIGSGAGHWIDFWSGLGCEVSGIDVSQKAVDHLREKHPDKTIYHGTPEAAQGSYSIINAIGVMFHIVDDAEWAKSLDALCGKLEPGGLLIVGGHFGWLDGLNVQITDGQINKRLRSRWRWRRELSSRGVKSKLYGNNAYLSVDYPLPENNVLVGVKG